MAVRRPKRNGREVKTKRKHENSSMGTLCSLANVLAACWFAVVASCRTLALSMHTCIQFLCAKESLGGHAATPESRGVALSIVRAPVSVFYDQSTLPLLHNSLCIFVCHGMYSVALCSRVRGQDDFIVIQRATSSFSVYISCLLVLHLVLQLPLSGSRAIAFQTFSSIFCTNRIFAVGAGGIARTSWERKTSVSQACLYDVYEP